MRKIRQPAPIRTPDTRDVISSVLSTRTSAGYQVSAMSPPGTNQVRTPFTSSGRQGWWSTSNSNNNSKWRTQVKQPSGSAQYGTRQFSLSNQQPEDSLIYSGNSPYLSTATDCLTSAYKHRQTLQHIQVQLEPGASTPTVAQTATLAKGTAYPDQCATQNFGDFVVVAAPAFRYPLPSPTHQVSPPDVPYGMMLATDGTNGQPVTTSPLVQYHCYREYQPLPGMSGVLVFDTHCVYKQPEVGPYMGKAFKCDQCMQSFRRNHDLTRHKNIHLVVKPFPCKFRSKRFSRKDALMVCLYNSRFRERMEHS